MRKKIAPKFHLEMSVVSPDGFYLNYDYYITYIQLAASPTPQSSGSHNGNGRISNSSTFCSL